MNAPLLRVSDLSVSFDTDEGRVDVVDRASFDLQHGETLGIVGESGCGKSVTALAVIGLLPHPSGHITGGQILLEDEDITDTTDVRRREIRGNRIAMIFQEPMSALNPVQRIGKQLTETLQLHQPELSDAEMSRRSKEMLDHVGIPDPTKRMEEYPHQLSGGMRQRVMIAIALMNHPSILIADEPTTALDVTIQAQILELLRDLQAEHNMSIIFITHDLGVIAEMASTVAVMYAGRIVERTGIHDLFENPLHPYTMGLLRSIPRLESTPKTELPTIPGVVPSLDELPSGCRFNNRCQFANERCVQEVPKLESASTTRIVACHHWRSLRSTTTDATA